MITGKTERALRELQRIACINKKKDVVQSLTTEVREIISPPNTDEK
jgi:hypothetical protein